MLKVNVYIKHINGKAEYRNVYCSGATTIKELFQRVSIPTSGAIVFIEGQNITDPKARLGSLHVPNPCFVSVRYKLSGKDKF